MVWLVLWATMVPIWAGNEDQSVESVNAQGKKEEKYRAACCEKTTNLMKKTKGELHMEFDRER